jgi:hypothetical protein
MTTKDRIREFLANKGSPCIIESQEELEVLVSECGGQLRLVKENPFVTTINELLASGNKKVDAWLTKKLDADGSCILDLVPDLVCYADDKDNLVSIGVE